MSKIDTTNVVAWQSVHYGIPIDETHDPAEAQKWLDSGVTVRPLYTSPQPSKPLTGILSIAYSGGRVVACSFKTEAEAKAFEQYAIKAAHKGDA